jgi:S1-C subfamily serine protease
MLKCARQNHHARLDICAVILRMLKTEIRRATNQITNKLLFFVEFALIGLGVGFLVLIFSDNVSDILQISRAPGSYADAVAIAAPTVVSIHTLTAIADTPNPLLDDPLFRNFFRLPASRAQPQVESSIGNGVIVDPNGFVLTNHHVVDSADGIQVALFDGRVATASLVGSDPETDIAVLKINQPNLPTIRIGDSKRGRVGDVVLAIGNPLGIGQTVSQGLVSATGRNRVEINTLENFIQIDAAINPGNSGGQGTGTHRPGRATPRRCHYENRRSIDRKFSRSNGDYFASEC